MNQDDCEGFSLKLFFSKILSLGGACKKQSVSLFVLNMVEKSFLIISIPQNSDWDPCEDLRRQAITRARAVAYVEGYHKGLEQ